ncbi:MAG: NTP transferase domain-containing protein [Clostridiales bacterium]|jgi:broad specificity phosphatase PhoE/CTP:molybdopterin cytidylyltransferase MocA|nr:NTP transferase domain-containing protein [Clostridiales bacterium]
MRAAAIILSAGYSSRMGAFKPLLPINGIPAVAMAAQAAAAAGAQVFVLTGHNRSALSRLIEEKRYTEVFNGFYDRGMFSSIQAGIAEAARHGGFTGALLWPCDCPIIPSRVAKSILDEAERHPGMLVVPCCAGKNGHPLYIPSEMFRGILDYNEPGGMKSFLKCHKHMLHALETDCDAVLLDMDTKQGYERILRCAAEPSDDVGELMRSRRIWLLRHGETQRQPDRIFLGQTDIALSARGRKQAGNAALELIRAGCRVKTIYTSPLKRSYETACIAAGYMGADVIAVDGFREMSLGSWDGEPVEKIRLEQREAYERRGREILTYLIDENSENFYDLRRRVKSAVIEVLNSDTGSELLFVTHSGVIRALWSLALGETMAAAHSRCNPETGGWMLLGSENLSV